MQGPPVRRPMPGIVRIRIMGEQRGGSRGTGVLVPPGTGDRFVRWVLITRHTWIAADRDVENIMVFPTHFVTDTRVNRLTGNVIDVDDFLEGEGDVAAVRLADPIELPAGMELPPLDWDHQWVPDEPTEHFGFGAGADDVVRGLRGRVVGPQPDLDFAPAVVIRTTLVTGTPDDGDSGGAIRVNGRIVGLHAEGAMDENDNGTVNWAPLRQEQALRQQLEARINQAAVEFVNGQPQVNFTCPSTSSA
jgi:hypothetical protein